MSELEEDLTWGEGYATHKNHAKEHRCINYSYSCSCNKFLSEFYESSIIGIQKTPEELDNISEMNEYLVIMECPECFTRFWWHAPESTAKFVKLLKEKK